MRSLAEFVVRVADLVEAEGHAARLALREEGRRAGDAARRLMIGAMFAAAGAALLATAAALLLGAAFVAARPVLGDAGSLALAGLLALGAAGGSTWACARVATTRPPHGSRKPSAACGPALPNGMLGPPPTPATPS